MNKRRLFFTSFFIILAIGVSAGTIIWYSKKIITTEKLEAEAVRATAKEEPQEITVKIYFGNKNMNSGGKDCGAVFPVERTIPNDLIIRRRAIEEILAGPTAAEKEAGYYSNVPDKAEVINYREKIKEETGEAPYGGEEVKIKSVKILTDSAYIDFSKEMMAYGEDKCRAEAIEAQLSETIKQFPNIGAGVMLIDGERMPFFPN